MSTRQQQASLVRFESKKEPSVASDRRYMKSRRTVVVSIAVPRNIRYYHYIDRRFLQRRMQDGPSELPLEGLGNRKEKPTGLGSDSGAHHRMAQALI